MTYKRWLRITVINFVSCALVVLADLVTSYMGFAQGLEEIGFLTKDLTSLCGNEILIVMGAATIIMLGIALLLLKVVSSRSGINSKTKLRLFILLNAVMLAGSVWRVSSFVIPNVLALGP